MISYLDAFNKLYTRGLTFDLQQYLFCLMVALGENKNLAYCMVYDKEGFAKNVNGEDEETYLISHAHEADVLLQQQQCQHLVDLVKGWLQSKIQKEASNIKNVKYSTEDVANMLSSLLYERSSNLEDASVRDIVALIRELNSQGALDGDGTAFSKHFINVYPHMTALCPMCQKETDIAIGMTCNCTRCGAQFVWSNEENRYYPRPIKL